MFLNCFIQHLKLKRLLVSPSFIAINTLCFLIRFFLHLLFHFEFYIHSPRHVSSKFAPLRTQHNFMSSSGRRTVNFTMLACCCIPPHWITCEMCTYSASRKWHRKEKKNGTSSKWWCSESIISIFNELKWNNIDVLICQNSFRFTLFAALFHVGCLLDVIYLFMFTYSLNICLYNIYVSVFPSYSECTRKRGLRPFSTVMQYVQRRIWRKKSRRFFDI